MQQKCCYRENIISISYTSVNWKNLHWSELVTFAVDTQNVWVQPGTKCSLHDGPVLRVGIQIANVAAAACSHESRRTQLSEQLRSDITVTQYDITITQYDIIMTQYDITITQQSQPNHATAIATIHKYCMHEVHRAYTSTVMFWQTMTKKQDSRVSKEEKLCLHWRHC